MTEQRKNRLKRKLQESRFRLNRLNKEFAEPLKEMLYVATRDVRRMSTNGACIYFDPDWLQKLEKRELDFIISHQLMHIALGHIERPRYYSGDRFHLACDIVANSNLECFGWKYEKLSHIGKIFHETFFPAQEGSFLTAQEALRGIPFDPAAMASAERRKYMIDSEEWWDKKDDRGERGIIVLSPGEEDPEDLFDDEITSGGTHFFFRKEQFKKREELIVDKNDSKGKSSGIWESNVADEILSLRSALNRESEKGNSEDVEERVWQRGDSSKIDWRNLLNFFVQEDVCDYSFAPPDRRIQDSEFFLPDYNVISERPKEVLFMVDTSGSVSDDILAEVYGEICNAISLFEGGLAGILAFFDMRVYPPAKFTDISDLLKIKPRGHGGTDFGCIFDYLQKNLAGEPPVSIVIFTDGQADFPNEASANNIPVLWLLSDKKVKPPWGKYAYMENC